MPMMVISRTLPWSTSDMNCEKLTRSEEHTSELQSQSNLVCRLLLEKKYSRSNRVPAELSALLTLRAASCFTDRSYHADRVTEVDSARRRSVPSLIGGGADWS